MSPRADFYVWVGVAIVTVLLSSVLAYDSVVLLKQARMMQAESVHALARIKADLDRVDAHLIGYQVQQ